MKFLINPFLNNKLIRKIIEIVFEIHHARKLPKYTKSVKRMLQISNYKSKAIYFSGCFALYHDKEEFESVVKILEKTKTHVEISSKLFCCDIASITKGFSKNCHANMCNNIDILDDYVQNNYKIIFSSPSCMLAFKKKYKEVLNSEKLNKLSLACIDIHEYLLSIIKKEKIEFKPLNKTVYVHIPCHARVLNLEEKILEIFKLIPGLKILPSLDVCCGMGGAFGMKKENFDLSMEIGEPLFNEIKSQKPDFVITNCGTCKMQIEQGTGYKVYHTMEILNKIF